MTDTIKAPTPRTREMNWKNFSLRLIIALPLALFSIWIVITLYEPFTLIAGMIMDSCSGSVVYTLWEIWLRVLWAGVLLVSGLTPPLLIMLRRRWRWVLLSLVFGTGVSVTWYLLWFVIAAMSCE